jgi:hypothetical protein
MLRIANGRLCRDQNKGDFICVSHQGCSVIDYLLFSNRILEFITDFNIEHRTESSHLPLSFGIECQNIDMAIVNKVYNKDTKRNRFIFNDSDITTFREKLAEILSSDFVNKYI